jgi:hypothetical protein
MGRYAIKQYALESRLLMKLQYQRRLIKTTVAQNTLR